MELQAKVTLVHKTLDDGKGRDIKIIDVAEISSFTDTMVICTGTSTTHARALGEAVAQAMKDAGDPPLGVEAGPEPDWILVDCANVVVHVMTEAARAHYALEKLWDIKPTSAVAEA